MQEGWVCDVYGLSRRGEEQCVVVSAGGREVVHVDGEMRVWVVPPNEPNGEATSIHGPLG